MKFIVSITLLSIFLLKIGGYYTYLNFERQEIREEMEQKMLNTIPKSSLTCIVANPENLTKIEWERADKEFSFEGNLYDIVSIEVVSGVTHYYCLNDQAETQLENKIAQFLDSQNESIPLNGNAKLLLHSLLEPLTAHKTPAFFFTPSFSNTSSVFPQIVLNHAFEYVSKLKRPPNFIKRE